MAYSLDAAVAARAQHGWNDLASIERWCARCVRDHAYVHPAQLLLLRSFSCIVTIGPTPTGYGAESIRKCDGGLAACWQTNDAHACCIIDWRRYVDQSDVIVSRAPVVVRMVDHALRRANFAARPTVDTAESQCNIHKSVGCATSCGQNPAAANQSTAAGGLAWGAPDFEEYLIRELTIAGSVAVDDALIDFIFESITSQNGQRFVEGIADWDVPDDLMFHACG